ncbi:hypothetical protein ABK040_015275 [Willaertia magna]
MDQNNNNYLPFTLNDINIQQLPIYETLLKENENIKINDLINQLPSKRILIFGSGNFGMALAYHLATLNQQQQEEKNQITIFSRDLNVVNNINENHCNPKYLKQLDLPANIKATNILNKELFQMHDALLFCIPTQFLRNLLQEKIREYVSLNHLLIFANKGMEMGSLALSYDIIKDCLGEEYAINSTFLSGPSFAVEIISHQPTCATISSKDVTRALWAQKVFHHSTFRIYTSDDVIGVEVCGALKNVIAIASGICSGLGFQLNTRAALLTRGLNEITKISHRLGGNPLTSIGLSGVGDLFVTKYNVSGVDKTLDDILKELGSVAEGVETTKAAVQLIKKLDMRCPIIEEVHKILFENKNITQAVKDLLEEEKSVEFTLYHGKLV